MATALPSDPVLLESTLVERIIQVFMSVPLVADRCNVYGRERFVETDDDDIEVSTKPDPVTELPITSIISIGLPSIEELPYTGDTCTQLNFVYPITFDHSVIDLWDDPALEFENSSDLCKAIYMRSRRKFKLNDDGSGNRDLGFINCVHEYLQQDAAGTVEDEDSGGRLHVFDWSLTIKCTGVLV
jgi:hypothetical protein